MVGSDIQLPERTWQSREHFLSIAARTMRRVLVGYARRRGRLKRGAQYRHVPLFDESKEVQHGRHVRPFVHLAVDQALDRLERFAPDEARVVELRFFGGLTLDQTADCMGVSRRTVVRLWRRARAWLRSQLGDEGDLDS